MRPQYVASDESTQQQQQQQQQPSSMNQQQPMTVNDSNIGVPWSTGLFDCEEHDTNGIFQNPSYKSYFGFAY